MNSLKRSLTAIHRAFARLGAQRTRYAGGLRSGGQLLARNQTGLGLDEVSRRGVEDTPLRAQAAPCVCHPCWNLMILSCRYSPHEIGEYFGGFAALLQVGRHSTIVS
jgi:hypothetical protein